MMSPAGLLKAPSGRLTGVFGCLCACERPVCIQVAAVRVRQDLGDCYQKLFPQEQECTHAFVFFSPCSLLLAVA